MLAQSILLGICDIITLEVSTMTLHLTMVQITSSRSLDGELRTEPNTGLSETHGDRKILFLKLLIVSILFYSGIGERRAIIDN